MACRGRLRNLTHISCLLINVLSSSEYITKESVPSPLQIGRKKSIAKHWYMFHCDWLLQFQRTSQMILKLCVYSWYTKEQNMKLVIFIKIILTLCQTAHKDLPSPSLHFRLSLVRFSFLIKWYRTWAPKSRLLV